VASFEPIWLYLVAVIGFALISLVLPHLIAPRKPTAVKQMPYESGLDPVEDARPLEIPFYLLAIVFLVIDVELVLVLPYAVALGSAEGIPPAQRPVALAAIAVLVATLVLAYLLMARNGVFAWRQRIRDRE
jgi:NADH-quinone oxidoreductase subunit A